MILFFYKKIQKKLHSRQYNSWKEVLYMNYLNYHMRF